MAKQTKPIIRPISDAAYNPVGDRSRNYNYDGTPLNNNASWDAPLENSPNYISNISGKDFYTGDRYTSTIPGTNFEESHAQQQNWTNVAFNGMTKGLSLTGTTFLQTTVGLFNGVIQASNDGRWASFYDNDFNRTLDEFNKGLEDKFASYESEEFKNAAWYSPDYLFTGNFLWEGVIKNLGFAAGAALSGGVFAQGVKWASKLPGISKLASTGKIAEGIAKSEAAISGVTDLSKIKGMSDNFLVAYSALNKGQRVLVAGLATTGEAGIEAYHNLNEWRDTAIETFVEENGRQPNSEELSRINDIADSIGNSSFVGNMALLTGTNYIQFPKILGSSYKAEKGIINEFASKTGRIVKEGGEYVSKTSRIRKIGRVLTHPYLFSYSEAFEEGSQFALGKATEDYYEKKNLDQDHGWFNSLMEGYKETLTTDEGMKNVLIGGLSGSIMLAKGKIRDARKTRRNTSDAIDAFNKNKLSGFMSDTYDAIVRGSNIQEEREEYLKDGDILNSKNAEADYVINYLSPRIKYGRFDLVVSDIKTYKELAASEAGWEQLVKDGIAQPSDTKEAFSARLQNFENTARNVKSLYQSLNVRYKGIMDADGKSVYPDEVIDKMVYAASKISDLDDRYQKLSTEVINKDINIDEIATATVNKDDSVLNTTLAKIKLDETITSTQKEELAEKVVDAAQIAVLRNNFLKEYDAIKNEPNKFKNKVAADIPEAADKQEIIVKTGKVSEKKVTTGEPYYLVENIKPSKDGVRPIRKAHTVKILKQSEDGSVEMEFENGVVKTVSPEQLSTYNLGSVAETDANPKAKYVLEHLDEEFVHLGIGQDGKKRSGKDKAEPAKGVIQYNSEDDIVEFVWQTPYGKTYTREVPNTMFVAKKGSNFKGGMVRRTGTTLTEKQRKAEQGFFKGKVSFSEKLKRRMTVASGLYKNLLKEVTTIANKIEANSKKLADLDQQIADAYKTKTGKPRKRITKDILNTITELEKLRETIPQENERLKEQQILLEGELDTVKEFVDSIDLMSNIGTQMVDDIKQEMEDLESMITLTKDAIKQTERQLPLIEAIYQKALRFLNNFIGAMIFSNPGIPLSIEEYKTNMEKFLGEEGAEGVISRKEGFTEQVLDIENMILSHSEGINFPKHEAKFLQMSSDLQEMKDALPKLEANLRAQEKILQAFRDFYREQVDLHKAEEVLEDNGKVIEQMDSSLDKSGEVLPYDPDFKATPLKSDTIIPTASIGIQDGKVHQNRANLFGFNLPKLQEAGKSIEAVYLTIKNEAALGMTGLIKKLSVDEQGNLKEGINPDKIIVTVMITETDDGIVPVGVEGDPITEGDILDQAIYQVMPLGTLINSKGSMFRKNTPKDVRDEIITRYTEWREEVLSRTDIDAKYEPQSSFGILSFEEEQRTSVADAKFIENETVLERKVVINVSTTQEVLAKGTTEYPNPYKRILIETDSGYAQLQNKQHSKEQALTIYKAIHGLAYELTHNKDGLNSPQAFRLLDYLKGVVYWGLPTSEEGKLSTIGHSSVYFQTEPGATTPTLFVGNKNKRFVFSPTGVRNSVDEIVATLQGLYTNTNYKKVRDNNKAYEEIIDINEEGEIIETRLWPNYQSYLLSAFLPNKDGDGLSKDKRKSIPLTTVANPITDSNPVNRTAIYFYNPEMQENYTVEAKKRVNFKDPSSTAKPSTEITDEALVNIIEGLGAEYIAKLDEQKTPEARVEMAKKLFVHVALDAILEASEDINTIADPEAKAKAKLEEAKDYNERSKNVPLDKKVASMWDAYQITVGPVKPSEEELMEGFGEISIGAPVEEIEEITGENISSKGSELAKKLTNPGNNLQVEYKGRIFRNAEHAYQTWKSGEFDEKAFNSTSFKPVGSKPTNKSTNYQTMVDILTHKFNQHPELIRGIKARGGVKYIQNSTHNVTGDRFWESKGQNKFIEALEEAYNTIGEQVESPTEEAPTSISRRRRKGRKRDYRRKLKGKYGKPENWDKAEAWLKKNFPNLPVYRLKTIIKNTNGDQFWGMFEKGAIYVYENAEEGTVYHEVFEGVWKTFTDAEEQEAVINEFKTRKGSFLDKTSGKTVQFSKATDYQIKEQLAEEFRSFINKRGLPKGIINKAKSAILKMFRDLKNFILRAFKKPTSDINQLFERIDSGYYKKYMPYTEQLSFAEKGIIDSDEVIITDDGDFSGLGALTDAQANDTVEELIYSTLNRFIANDRDLFSLDPVKVSDKVLIADIRDTIQIAREETVEAAEDGEISEDQKSMELVELFQLQKNIEKNFPAIKKLFVSRIASYGVSLDDANDVAQINSEDKTRNSDYIDATKVDKFKKMNKALKLLFNTVAMVDEDGADIPSEIHGVRTLSFGQVSNTLIKALYKSRNLNEMQENFRKLAEKDPNFRRLYKRFFKASYTERGVGFKHINNIPKFRLISGLWKTFSLQAPEVKNVFILENGDIEVGDASLSTEATQLRSSFMNNIILRSKGGAGFFKFSPSSSTYVVNKDKLKTFKLKSTKTSHKQFLEEYGIYFSVKEMNNLTSEQYKLFREVVGGMRMSLNKISSVRTFSSTSLDLHGRLLKLALLKAAATSSSSESTYFNVAGERTQTFIGSNAPSRLYKFLSQINNLRELEGTELEYLIPGNDKFTEGSIIISKMFDKDGNRKQDFNEDKLMSVGYAGGTINERKGKKIQSSKLKFRDRFLQEISLNLKGWYLNLVPGDSSTEWMTFLGNHIDDASLNRGFVETHAIFRKYFISEVNLSREDREVYTDPFNPEKSRNPKDLRFLQNILDLATITSIKRSKIPADKLYDRHEEAIKSALESHINKNKTKLKNTLVRFNAIQPDFSNEGKFRVENVNINNVSEKQLDTKLTMLTINYMINNIEQHKILYGDPYQYKDELKRTKSFQSPRQELLNSSNEVNSLMDEIWNKNYKDRLFGRTNFFRDHFRTVTLADVRVISEFSKYGVMEETDGGGIISFRAHRNFKLRSSDWTEGNEKQFEYEIAWEEAHKTGLRKIREGKQTEEGLTAELAKLKNPKVKDTFTALKPVVTGNRVDENKYNKTVLDKYSLYPLSYRIMVQINAKNGVALHNKMGKEDIDYVIFNSGRKVGAYHTATPYNEKGGFNRDAYADNTIINIPFSIIGLQTEVPSKDDGLTTRGSQATKIITMDRMDAGVPIDYNKDEASFSKRYREWNNLTEDQKLEASDLYTEIILNKELLQGQIQFGYDKLLKKLGIVENADGTIQIENFEKTVNIIKNEVLLRDSNDNIIRALDSFMKETSVLEATPAYRQISNILYSIVDKNIVHPKISGGMKVQIPSTFWEENRLGIQKINGKEGYTSDALGFYVDEATGDNVMEIFAGRWFKSNMSDAQLLEYLNTTKDGQEILRGFAFRIPTQNMNSIDAFRIKKFLPEEFGDNVVVPSAIVGKVGSDFDIDKLSMYLKNVLEEGYDYSGKPQVVKYYGIGEDAKAKAKEDADFYYLKEFNLKKGKLEKETSFSQLFSDIYLGKKIDPKKQWKWVNIFRKWHEKELQAVPVSVDENGDTVYDLRLSVELVENKYMNILDKYNKRLDELTDAEIFEGLVDNKGSELYEQGLQNAYIDSNIRLLTHPTNHEKLTSPNSAKEMEDLARDIHVKLGNEVVEYSNPVNFLDRTFMSQLRHDFVAGKGGIGIAAVGQTNHANNQHQLIVVDKNKMKLADPEEQKYFGDGEIKFKRYNSTYIKDDAKSKSRKVPTLSFIKNKADQYISDIMGMFVDGYVDISNGPWIMQMGATPETTATWQFLIKIGVPLKDVAYFMNQPIIKDYLQMIENKGYSWLFINTYTEKLKSDKYHSNSNIKMETIPPTNILNRTIGATKLSDLQKAQQQFYLDEFLKYAMMSRHLFYFTQGTNFDTTSFNNPFLLFKKEEQLKVARSSVISSPDTMLDSTFLGYLKNVLGNSREALKEVLISDKPNSRKVVENALRPYIHLPNRDFVKMAEKVITNLFDWAMQTQTGINNEISDILINKNNIAQRMNAFVKDVKRDPGHPLTGNYVMELIEVMPSKRAEVGSTDNIRIKTNTTEVYDQNRMIYAFKEIKEFLGNESDLYEGLVKLSILQSGLSPSSLSFTSLLPFDDFVSFYNETLTLLEDQANLGEFNNLHVFERNNWNNSDLVGYKRADWIPTDAGMRYNPGMEFLNKGVKEAIKKEEIPQIMTAKVGSRSTPFMSFTWEDQVNSLTTEELAEIKKRKGSKIEYLKKKKERMRKDGDFSFIHKTLMQRVKKADGTWFIDTIQNKKGEDHDYYVYKAINAWGNGPRANEFYDVATVSEINNGYEPQTEASDSAVLEVYENSKQKKKYINTRTNVKVKNPNSTMSLKGKTYKFSQIDSKLLVSLGYTDQAEMGRILKIVCK